MMNYEDTNLYQTGGTTYGRTFTGDTYYLDRFMNDCYTYKDAHNAAKRKKNKFGNIVTVLFLLIFITLFIVAFSGDEELLNILSPILFLLFFAFMFGVPAYVIYSFVRSIRKVSRLNSEADMNFETNTDNIHYEYVNEFLTANNIKKFDFMGKAFCINDGSTYSGKRSSIKSLILIFVIATVALLGSVTFLAYNKFGTCFYQHDDFFAAIMCAVFGLVPIGFIVFGFLGHYLKRLTCREKVDAVCVEVYSKISRDSDGDRTRVYKPFYYLKYNGKGYILFNNTWSNISVPEVGDVRESIFINPDNPLEYCEKISVGMIIFYLLFIIGFSLPTIIIAGQFLF